MYCRRVIYYTLAAPLVHVMSGGGKKQYKG